MVQVAGEMMTGFDEVYSVAFCSLPVHQTQELNLVINSEAKKTEAREK